MIDKNVFIKTHGTGSSTLTGVLHWFCENHAKRCYISPEDYSTHLNRHEGNLIPCMTYGSQSLAPIVANQAGSLDIWANHVRLLPDMLNTLIPGNFKI
mmetsp:Transcript_2554/g.5625  ORF Transcript_2554/g.5625 Transcript_2554/m.5625 type:complete len:98 (-) Transcript_2554:666-959(-)